MTITAKPDLAQALEGAKVQLLAIESQWSFDSSNGDKPCVCTAPNHKDVIEVSHCGQDVFALMFNCQYVNTLGRCVPLGDLWLAKHDPAYARKFDLNKYRTVDEQSQFDAEIKKQIPLEQAKQWHAEDVLRGLCKRYGVSYDYSDREASLRELLIHAKAYSDDDQQQVIQAAHTLGLMKNGRIANAIALEQKKSVYQPKTIGEMIDSPRPRWLIRGVVPERGIGVMFGPPGSGKSFLTLDMCAAIARGEPWLDSRTKQGVVIYIGLEGSMRGRVEAYLKRNELAPDALNNLRIIERAPLSLLGDAPDVAMIISSVKRTLEPDEQVRLVVIDTLARAMSGGDENGTDMGVAVGNAERLSRALNCVTMLVHHSGKDASKGARGHSSLLAALDFELEVSRDHEDRRVRVSKLRDGEDNRAFSFRLVPVDLGASVDHDEGAELNERDGSLVVEHFGAAEGKAVTAKLRLGKHAANALTALHSMYESPFTSMDGYVSLDAWQDSFFKLYAIPESLSADERRAEMVKRAGSFRDARAELTQKAMIETNSDGHQIKPK